MEASISFLALPQREWESFNANEQTHGVPSFKHLCERLIEEERCRDICEIGGGCSPLFSVEEIRRMGINYTIVDLSHEELDAASHEYNKVCVDICDGLPNYESAFDFAFSRFLAEHVRSGDEMHRSIHAALRPGGIACHLFPTLFSPVFVLNWLLPEGLSRRIVDLWFPGKRKFPARYSWCFGPTKRMLDFLKRSGFEIQNFQAFYGSGYFSTHALLKWIDVQIAKWGQKRRNPYLSSYALVILKKPMVSSGPAKLR